MSWDFEGMEAVSRPPKPPAKNPKRNWNVCPKCGESYTGTEREHLAECRPVTRIEVGMRVKWRGKEYVLLDIGDFGDTGHLIDETLDYHKNVPYRDMRVKGERNKLPDEAPF